MLRFLVGIFLCVSGCSFFAPANIQTKRSTDLDGRGIKRIAVVLPNGRLLNQRPRRPMLRPLLKRTVRRRAFGAACQACLFNYGIDA